MSKDRKFVVFLRAKRDAGGSVKYSLICFGATLREAIEKASREFAEESQARIVVEEVMEVDE